MTEKAKVVKKRALGEAAVANPMLEQGMPVELSVPASPTAKVPKTPKVPKNPKASEIPAPKIPAKPANDPRPFLRVRVEERDRDRFKVIAAERRMTIQDLMIEALNRWLVARRYPKLETEDDKG